uniref:B30.2/SPRY domain-containing protein n=1 Tax=Periophthalmus magnuspinnatus TaxID=409849 RepID=A0A3B4A6K6_9GOBI
MENVGLGPGLHVGSKDEPGPNIRSNPGPAPGCVSLSSDWSKEWFEEFRGRAADLRSVFSSVHPPKKRNEVLTDYTNGMKNMKIKLGKKKKESLQNRSDLKLSVSRSTDNDFLFCLGRAVGVGDCKDKLKSHLRQRFSRVSEGVAKAADSASLTQFYTELYITESGTSEVNQDHEVRHIENASRRPAAPETTITCEDIFKPHQHSPEAIRFVLTKGVAGVGKTVLTQKLSLDWAEGRAHQDLQLLFPFTFRELNMLRDTQFSLVGLLHHFFSPSKDLSSFQQLQVLFIFDGLDECRLPLDFSGTPVLTDPTEAASVHVLLVNLIRGRLLPSAQLWITTRPAAANQIPAECISMVTEVRGFTDLQKEQYFRKRFRVQAAVVISHIKSIRSLHIMSHIPVFCWILSTVLQRLLEQTDEPELPRTLTQMYVYFLVVQAKVQNIKYHQGSVADLHWTPETREMVESLGKVAFEQLQKGNLIFYECDLSECGLDAAAASVYSGVFTQVFREEPGLYQDKVYCFIHLSVQEFLAALHVHQTFINTGVNLLEVKPPSIFTRAFRRKSDILQRSAVDQALQSPNGHLDLFLRFLLGLSLPTNQRLLQGLLTQTGSDQTNQETVKYIKQKLNEKNLSAERSLNLFHCLNELNDHSLVQEIQKNMREGQLSTYGNMSPAQWSALSFLLLSSDSDLEEFDLKKYQRSETALLVIGCGLSPHICGPLASVLSSSSLTHLDLSHNEIQDSGVELLCSGLKSTPCRLETLRLSACLVSERGGAALASALSSASSHLRELDLSFNHPGPSAELLTALQDQHPLLLDPGGERWMLPGPRKYSCEFSLDLTTAHKCLLLSEDCQTVSRVTDEQQYPDHKERFTYFPQVLSSSSLQGRCYWELEWSGEKLDIAVSYRGIGRGVEKENEFGKNDQSWNLWIDKGKYWECHNHKRTSEIMYASSNRVGVFLNSEAGTLTFYQVLSGGQLSPIYSFSCSFTEPLFPGYGLYIPGSSLSLVKLT